MSVVVDVAQHATARRLPGRASRRLQARQGANLRHACVAAGLSALASIVARHARGLLQLLEGLLRRMVKSHEAGSLSLDRTLFGLANELMR